MAYMVKNLKTYKSCFLEENMQKLAKDMKRLHRRTNEKLVFMYIYHKAIIRELNDTDIYTQHKLSISEISSALDINHNNVWFYVKSLCEKEMIDTIKVEGEIQIIL